MRNPIKIKIFLLATIVIAFSGCSSEENKKASFRIGQFLLNSEKATITFYEGKKETTSLELNYGQLSEFQSIEAKIYSIKVWADGKLLLEKKLGMGSNGKYTLLLTGIPEKNQQVNKESTSNILHSIAEGSEGITTNNFLPQLLVQDDFYIKEKNRGKVSVTNLMPGTVPVTMSLVTDGGETKIDAVAYPETSKIKVVETGFYAIKFHLNGNPQSTLLGEETIENGVLYSLYVIPNPNKYLTLPKLIIGKIQKRK